VSALRKELKWAQATPLSFVSAGSSKKTELLIQQPGAPNVSSAKGRGMATHRVLLVPQAKAPKPLGNVGVVQPPTHSCDVGINRRSVVLSSGQLPVIEAVKAGFPAAITAASLSQ
jgi:hypothetical protein